MNNDEFNARVMKLEGFVASTENRLNEQGLTEQVSVEIESLDAVLSWDLVEDDRYGFVYKSGTARSPMMNIRYDLFFRAMLVLEDLVRLIMVEQRKRDQQIECDFEHIERAKVRIDAILRGELSP